MDALAGQAALDLLRQLLRVESQSDPADDGCLAGQAATESKCLTEAQVKALTDDLIRARKALRKLGRSRMFRLASLLAPRPRATAALAAQAVERAISSLEEGTGATTAMISTEHP